MSTNAPTAIKAIYTERSSSYDVSPFHLHQAQEYIHCANLQPGQSLLDLACGTGLVTILAKQHLGPTAKVVGVDFSHGMLQIARQKTLEQGLDITYIEHDITDLGALELGTFDAVTCASALLLMPDPLKAVKHWASLLAPNGRLLTDVVIERDVIAPAILTEIGPKIGRSMAWDGSWVESEDSLRRLFVDAGLVVEGVYLSEVYERREYKVEHGADVFEKTVANPQFRNFGDEEVRGKAKGLFVERFRELADGDGVVREEIRFYMGIARKKGGA
ncbi:MAG: hypothetical protein Q9182_005733 [Xanthomendoza sp. 2 TL-2023]